MPRPSVPWVKRARTSSSFTGGVQVGWTREAHFQGALVLQKAFSLFHQVVTAYSQQYARRRNVGRLGVQRS